MNPRPDPRNFTAVLIRTRLEDLSALGQPLHLALGVFDGVHIGHQAVIARAVDAAKKAGGLAGLVTFDPHPIRVIAPGKAPRALLATLGHKARLVNDLGMDLFVPLHFDSEFAKMEAGTFLDQLLAAPVKTLAVGEDWRFGHHRGGDLEFLKQAAQTRGFTLEAVPPVMLDGDRISSTRIRQAIRDGNLEDARRMLGRPYSLSGTVIHGKQLGRTIGFPTANLDVGEAQLPPDGVWIVTARLGDGRRCQGVANLGSRPTVSGSGRLLEVHLFDFHEDLYDKEVEVEFRHHLRPEMKFPSFEDLKRRIEEDALAAREFFGRVES
ncbi:MAG: bifunctional riboflavin kinase/FAD synthetase [Luteolibacter sp.]